VEILQQARRLAVMQIGQALVRPGDGEAEVLFDCAKSRDGTKALISTTAPMAKLRVRLATRKPDL
jgi:hypothetical protein